MVSGAENNWYSKFAEDINKNYGVFWLIQIIYLIFQPFVI